jgi:hypothetical protein
MSTEFRVRTSHKRSGFRQAGLVRSRAAIAIAVSVFIVVGCGGGDDDDAQVNQQSLAQVCAALAPQSLPHGARFVRAEMRAASEELPEACIARGEIAVSAQSTINWAVELPAKAAWNGKTLTIGGGGFDGFIPTDSAWYQWLVGPSAHPYVKMSSDSGHQADGFGWAADEPALRAHAYEANHMTLAVGTALATSFYGRAPTRRYMYGQSNGGRSGLMAASRYPNDYDGVVAMEPAISQQAHQINMGPNNRWLYDTTVPAESHWISPAKTALFAAAELRACDSLDGLDDGVISNVEACTYVPTDLQCADDVGGITDDTCLTSGQIQAIVNNYTDKNVPVVLANDMQGYERYGRGGASTSDWAGYAFGRRFADRDGFSYIAPLLVTQMITGDANVDPLAHDPVAYADAWRRLSDIMEPTPSMSAFAARGGKLLVWYGLADTCVSVYRTARYLDAVKTSTGDQVFQQFARHLTSPGVGHELDGPGAGTVDLLAALDAWVERGSAPDNLTAAKLDQDGAVLFERPLCSFPAYPKYRGSGDPTEAASFSCLVHGT